MSFNGAEAHYWVWIIDGADIWYAGTYGGVCDIIVKKFNKARYLRRFINAIDGSLDDYAYVFQIEPAVSRVGFESVSYMKSKRY